MEIASFIGLRFLRSPRRTKTVSLVSLVSGLGVMFGVTALIVVISVMNGFRENMFLAITGTMANVRIMPSTGDMPEGEAERVLKRLRALPQVRAGTGYLSRQGFLRIGDEVRAVILRGIDPDTEPQVSELIRFVKPAPLLAGEAPTVPLPANPLQALAYPPPADIRAGILLGAALADGLNLGAGDEVDFISTEQRITPIGPVPLVKRFRVAAIFKTGMGNIDEVTAFVDMAIAQRLYRMGDAVGGLALRMDDPHSIDAAALRAAVPGYRVITWGEENRNIFQVMQLEKIGVFLVLLLIIVVAFFNIISSLIMLVLEKRKAIAILKSMGATNALVRKVFFMQGVWIGAVGTLGGLSLGLAACWALATFDLFRLPPGVFPTANRLPVRIEWDDLAIITATSFLICLLVTLYPATAAARTDPIKNLRNE